MITTTAAIARAFVLRPTRHNFLQRYQIGHRMTIESEGYDLSKRGGVNIYSASKEEISALLKEWGQPAFRAKQIHQWMFDKGVTDFDEMKDLPKELRAKLKSFYSMGVLQLVSEQISKDGTRKRAYQLQDGQLIESVLMPYRDGRRTACISSQAGCGMGCVFCATGQMGFARQLSAAEIFEQAQIFSTELKRDGERLSNVVFMGMGEPLANYKNVMSAVRRLNTDLGIGARHITLSTVGLAPRIRQLVEEGLQVGLAVSLHQTTDDKRAALMPVNKRYNIAELLSACRYYTDKTRRRISFEWALIRGDTDTEDTAHELGRLLKGMLCHVNVIPLNPTAQFGGRPTSKEGVEKFIAILASYGVTATPRTRRGIDIDAGCGQLKADLLKQQRKQPPLQHSVQALDTPAAELLERQEEQQKLDDSSDCGDIVIDHSDDQTGSSHSGGLLDESSIDIESIEEEGSSSGGGGGGTSAVTHSTTTTSTAELPTTIV